MDAEIPPVCRLDALAPADRARHAALTAELRSAARWIQELPRGWALRFPEDPALSRRLVEWVALERRCCPFLEFEILLGEKGDPVILRLTGGEGVKEILARELALSAPALEWPPGSGKKDRWKSRVASASRKSTPNP
jgi:hypothetical protein